MSEQQGWRKVSEWGQPDAETCPHGCRWRSEPEGWGFLSTWEYVALGDADEWQPLPPPVDEVLPPPEPKPYTEGAVIADPDQFIDWWNEGADPDDSPEWMRTLAQCGAMVQPVSQYVPEGHARIDGQVVRLHQPTDSRKKAVLVRKLRDWWPEKVAVDSKRGTPLYVAVPLDSDQAEPTGDARRPKGEGEADDE